MSRNGSGTYTIPNTFVSGTTITASGQNQNDDDLGDEITNSVAVDGQSTMTGALKLANGTAATPSVVFGSDSDTGLYRVAADTFGIAVAGQNVVSITTATAAFSGVVTQGGGQLVPAGSIMIWPTGSAPAGWVLCQGAAISRTSFAALFAAIGTTYGSGDGTTTFNVPDLLGTVVCGITGSSGRMFGFTSPGDRGGMQTITLSQANLPAGVNLPATGLAVDAHAHDFAAVLSIAGGTGQTGGGANIPAAATTGTTNPASSNTISGTVPLGGSSTPLNNVQPTMAMNYIIKT